MDERPRHERVVVIKHAFLREDFEVCLLVQLVIGDYIYCSIGFLPYSAIIMIMIFDNDNVR